MKYLTYIILIGTFLSACFKGERETSKVADRSNQITLIFEKKTDLGSKETSQVIVLKNITQVSYLNEFDEVEVLRPDHKYENDTITILTLKKSIELTHDFYGYEKRFNYQYEPGDTVLFSYDGDLPIAKILNRKYDEFDLNYNYYEAKKFDDLLYRNKILVNRRLDRKNQQKHWDDFQKTLFDKKSFLDSLCLKQAITKRTFVRQSLVYASALKDIGNYFSKYINESQFNELRYGANLVIDFPSFTMDSLLDYRIYRNIVFNYAISELIEDKKIIGVNFQIADYRASFDSVLISDKFSEKTKKFLLPVLLYRIAEDFSENDFQKYLGKLKRDINDSLLIGQIEKTFLLDMDELKNDIQNVHLSNAVGETSTLNDLLKQNHGKIIYLDLWASWCLPCRQAMPDSKKLRELYSGDSVVFAYLSVDKNKANWMKAAIADKLIDYPNSYLIVNAMKAEFFDEIGVKAIPRYLLYDQKGNLISKDAPGPTDNKLKDLFDVLLRKG